MRVFQGSGVTVAVGRDGEGIPKGGICYQVFGEGTNLAEFAPKLALLDQDTYRLLARVAVRISLIDGLGSAITSPSGEDIAPLQLYLLCTCIDSLANPSWLPFNDWLVTHDAKYEITSRDAALQRAQTGIEGQRDTGATAKRIRDVYGEYLKYHGITRKFRQFFLNLPDAAKRLLAGSYLICTGEENYLDPAVRQSWLDKPTEERLEAIARYLFEYRRNDFTHAGRTHSTTWQTYFQTPQEALDTRPYKPSGAILYFWEDDDPDKSVQFVVLAEHNEVFVLRAIILAHCRSMIGIKDDQSFIDHHSARHHQAMIIRNVLAELNSNWRSYRFYSMKWFAFEHEDDRYYGLPEFCVQWLKAALELDYSVYGVAESSLLQDTRAAIRLLTDLNEPIKRLNEQFPPLYVRHERADLKGQPEDFAGKVRAKAELFDQLQAMHAYHEVRWYLPTLLQSYSRMLIEVPGQGGPQIYGRSRPNYYEWA